MEFLTSLFQKGLKYSALGTARAALNNFIKICGGVDFSSNSLIQRFMRGVFLKRPALPKYHETWDVHRVLTFLEKLEDETLFELSGRLCMLFLLLSAQRCQTLHLIELEDIYFKNENLIIQTSHILKQTKPGKHLQNIVFKPFPRNKNLCIVACMKLYIQRTKMLRNNVSKLLIGTQKPHKGVARATISRWVKTILTKAGIDCRYGSHSTRAVSSSLAQLKGVSLDVIAKTAGWSNAKTFAKFYDKPVEVERLTVQDAVQNSTLS